MSISPPADLVLDVMRAADPQKQRAAAARLKQLAAMRAARAAPPRADWDKALLAPAAAASKGKAAAVPSASPGGGALAISGELKEAKSPTGEKEALRRSYAALEGVVTGNMLTGMMKGAGSGIFGGGLAGEYWKSLLAQAIATQVSRRGGLGMAAALMRRAGQPDAPAGAARALGVQQRMERIFLSGVAHEGAVRKEPGA